MLSFSLSQEKPETSAEGGAREDGGSIEVTSSVPGLVYHSSYQSLGPFEERRLLTHSWPLKALGLANPADKHEPPVAESETKVGRLLPPVSI